MAEKKAVPVPPVARQYLSDIGKRGAVQGGKKRWEGISKEERSRQMSQVARARKSTKNAIPPL